MAISKVIHILHPRYHPKLIGHVLRNKQKKKCVCIHEIIQINHNENKDENEYGYIY